MEYFCYAIPADSSAAYHKFATLTSVKDTVCKTMKILGLATSADSDGFTATGFFDRIIALERRSRALPKGSAARQDAQEEFVELMLDGLDEFGERWVDQFKAPVNYLEPMLTSFSDGNCFIYNKLDTAENTTDKTYQFRNILLKKRSRFNARDDDSAGSTDDEDDKRGQALPAHKGPLPDTVSAWDPQVLTGQLHSLWVVWQAPHLGIGESLSLPLLIQLKGTSQVRPACTKALRCSAPTEWQVLRHLR